MIVTHSDDFDGSCLFHVVDSMIGTAHLENQFSFYNLEKRKCCWIDTSNTTLNPTLTKVGDFYLV